MICDPWETVLSDLKTQKGHWSVSLTRVKTTPLFCLKSHDLSGRPWKGGTRERRSLGLANIDWKGEKTLGPRNAQGNARGVGREEGRHVCKTKLTRRPSLGVS